MISRKSPFRLGRFLWAAVLATGCTGGQEYGEVEGVVTDRGKPVAEVEVRFLPDPEAGNQGPTASAFTDKDGRYRLYTGGMQRAGVVVGWHRVCVRDPHYAPVGGATPGPAGPHKTTKEPPPRVPLKLSAPDSTPFRGVEVKGSPQIYDIDIGAEVIRSR